MIWQDTINGVFEAGGSVAVWSNVVAIYRDKGFAGGRVPAALFFCLFGIWNLYYYPQLGQFWSTIGGLSLAIANTSYIVLMFKYGRKK